MDFIDGVINMKKKLDKMLWDLTNMLNQFILFSVLNEIPQKLSYMLINTLPAKQSCVL